MTRKTANDFDPEVLKLFDQYVHGQIDRRGFLSAASRYAVGGATAASLLAALSPSWAAQQVAPTDPRIKASYVDLPVAERLWRTCAATWCSRPTPRASCRRYWWCTKTAA